MRHLVIKFIDTSRMVVARDSEVGGMGRYGYRMCFKNFKKNILEGSNTTIIFFKW